MSKDTKSLPFVSLRYGGKSWMVQYDPHFPDAKRRAERKLQEEVDHYKEQERISKLTVDQYLDELHHNIVDRCPNCGLKDSVIRRDRVQQISYPRTIASMLWLTSGTVPRDGVSPYRRCNICKNDFETQSLDKELLRPQAEAKHARAITTVTDMADEHRDANTNTANPLKGEL